MELDFEKDTEKAKSNFKGHLVSFQETDTIFYYLFFAASSDPVHSEEVERYICIGVSMVSHTLLVARAEWGNRTRINSGCVATTRPRKGYEEDKQCQW